MHGVGVGPGAGHVAPHVRRIAAAIEPPHCPSSTLSGGGRAGAHAAPAPDVSREAADDGGGADWAWASPATETSVAHDAGPTSPRGAALPTPTGRAFGA